MALLAPRTCMACDEMVETDPVGVSNADVRADLARHFCRACGPLLEPTPRNQRPPAIWAAVYRYGGPLREAILRLKHGGRSDLAGPMGSCMAAATLPLLGRVEAVVPVPLHRRRLVERGFNQAALLAKPVARTLGVPMRYAGLERCRMTPTLGHHGRATRVAAVAGAFRATGQMSGGILLIDDVRTTGATLGEAARVLLDRGASRVFGLTLAVADQD